MTFEIINPCDENGRTQYVYKPDSYPGPIAIDAACPYWDTHRPVIQINISEVFVIPEGFKT